jgi:hypothetical protein
MTTLRQMAVLLVGVAFSTGLWGCKAETFVWSLVLIGLNVLYAVIHANKPARQIIHEIDGARRAFAGGTMQQDDVMVVVIKRVAA